MNDKPEWGTYLITSAFLFMVSFVRPVSLSSAEPRAAGPGDTDFNLDLDDSEDSFLFFGEIGEAPRFFWNTKGMIAIVPEKIHLNIKFKDHKCQRTCKDCFLGFGPLLWPSLSLCWLISKESINLWSSIFSSGSHVLSLNQIKYYVSTSLALL